MSKKPLSKKFRDVLFSVLSFILALFLFLNSLCILISVFVFNKNVWLDQMNASNYYSDKTDEIKNKLVNLGNASGLPAEFFDRVVDSIQVSNDTENYLDAYFNGSNDLIDTTAFKQTFYTQLDEYVKEKNAKIDDSNVDYLVKNAEHIYARSLEIPLFYRLFAYFQALKGWLPVVIAVISALSLAIVLILLFGNKWKHRAFKYYYFACAGTFLSLFAVAVFITVAGGFQNIVLESRALYNMAVSFGTSAIIAFWAFTAFFLIVSFTLYFVYANKRKKVFATD